MKTAWKNFQISAQVRGFPHKRFKSDATHNGTERYDLENVLLQKWIHDVNPITIPSRLRSSNCLRGLYGISSHFEYLENRPRSLDETWQPVRRDSSAHPWRVSLSRGASQLAVRRRWLSLCTVFGMHPIRIFRGAPPIPKKNFRHFFATERVNTNTLF